MTALLDVALGYAARGIPVYPAHWPRPTPDGASLACSCPRGLACDRPAKHPLVHHGVKDATTDPDRLGRWWCRWPQANVGLATGFVFDALDIDGPDGLAALGELQEAAGLRLPGPLVATGGGGWRRGTTGLTEPMPVPEAGPKPAQPHTPADHPAQQPARADQRTPAGARARVRAAYDAQIQAGQTPTGAGLARAAGVSERYGQRLLGEFTTEPGRPGHRNGDGQRGSHGFNDADTRRSKGGDHG